MILPHVKQVLIEQVSIEELIGQFKFITEDIKGYIDITLASKFNELQTELSNGIGKAVEGEFLNAPEAMKRLGIRSRSKLQKMRDHFEIEFVQHGKIILYSKKSIDEFLSSKTVRL